MASSSSSLSSLTLQPKYDVFLSFRGEDTRDNFTSHLYAALCQKQIQTFIDDDELKRGDDISSELYEAIEQSKITPSDVRKQIGSFKDAFVKHENQFKKTPERVQRWRAALTEASNLSGWDSMVTRPESKLVKDIVKAILERLNEVSPVSNEYEGLVGINSRIERIKSLLCIGLSDVRTIGVWGMGGIGKTTLVGALFNQISNRFEGSCFIANVREMSDRNGLVHLRGQVLSQLLGEENLTIGTPNIPQYIKKRLQSKKVLIVLDDVNDFEHLEFLTMGIAQFGQGSRVIVTTRDKQVLDNFGVDDIYEVDRFNFHEAIQLFSNFAFKQKSPPKEFLKLSYLFVDYAKGNPLALKVLGSSVYRKTKVEWKGVLKKLSRVSNPKIYSVLKISYQGLDSEVQDIFLDIACFFKGYDSDIAKQILSSCYLSIEIGFSTLIDKSLMTISHNVLEMHDLLQEIGWEIVRKESPKEPGKRSRVWNHEDAFHVLRNNTGTDAVQGLFLDMSKITDLHLSAWAFEKMSNLKFLKFYASHEHIQDSGNINKLHLPQGLKYLPDELRCLCWYGYPLKTLPSNFSPKNLIALDLRCSSVDETLWLEKKYGLEVKLIEPSHADAPEPQQCESLVYSPSCIQYLANLSILTLLGCKGLRSFPSNIHFGSLITLVLSGCSNLTMFPQISGNNIKHLYLAYTAIDEVPSSIACLTGLNSLCLLGCKRLKRISSRIYTLKSLDFLSLSSYRFTENQLSSSISSWKKITNLWLHSCNILEIPKDICGLSSLAVLDLRGNDFESLPKSIKRLSHLTSVCLDRCHMLQTIPELPIALVQLSAMFCSQLQSLPELPSNLEELDEAEILSNAVFELDGPEYIFNFTGCPKLNQNADNNVLIDSQQRVQLMVTAALGLYCHEKVFNEIPQIGLCLPGKKIPEWFSHQSLGTSITIELHEHCCNKRFIGFSLSAVFTLDQSVYEDFDDVGVICTYNFGNNVEFNWGSRLIDPGDIFIESDHIVLGYGPFPSKGNSENTTVSFEFSSYNFRKKTADERLKIKCCGVHPLFVQRNITEPDTSIEGFAATSEGSGVTMLADSGVLMELPDTNTSENGRISNEEDANTDCSLRGSGLLLCTCWTSIMSLFWQT